MHQITIYFIRGTVLSGSLIKVNTVLEQFLCDISGIILKTVIWQVSRDNISLKNAQIIHQFSTNTFPQKNQGGIIMIPLIHKFENFSNNGESW